MNELDPNLTASQTQTEDEVPQPPTPSPQPPAPDPPWGLRELFHVVAFFVTAFLLSNFTAALLYSALSGHVGGLPKLTQLTGDARFILPVQFLAYVLTVGFIYLMVTWKYRRRFWETIRWKTVGERTSLFLTAGVMLAFASQLIPVLFPSDRPLPIEKLFNSPTSGYLLAAFGILIAPFVEELVFRGMMYPVFERHLGLMLAVVLTAALFAAIHAPQLGKGWPQVTAIFVVGLALSYARGRTGSLVPAYLIHLSYNSTLFVLLYISTEHFRKLPGG